MLQTARDVLITWECSKIIVRYRSESEARAIDGLIKDLESTGVLEDYDLTGTDWRLVYSSSTASSSGKIGPFIGRVSQVKWTPSHASQLASGHLRDAIKYTRAC